MELLKKLIKDRVASHRRAWLTASNQFLRDLEEDEMQVATLKADNRPARLIQTVEAKIISRIDFYNETEAYCQALHLEAVNNQAERFLMEAQLRYTSRQLDELTATLEKIISQK
jgi:hypothetical protein